MSTKIRIGLILQGNSAWMGGAEYSRNLVKALYRLPAELQAEFDLRLFSGDRLEDPLYCDMPARFRGELDLASPPLWVRAARRIVPGRFARWTTPNSWARRRDVQFLYPCHPLPRAAGKVVSAAWIPDFQHRHLPEFFSLREREERDRAFSDIAENAPCVALSSENAANDFRRFFPGAAHKARVLRFCTAADDAWFAGDVANVVQKHGLPARFFVVCNQFWQHKNHRVVFEALRLLKKQSIAPTVVCTGKVEDYRRPGFAPEVERMLDDLGVRAQVRLVGLLPRVEQIQLMRRALAVLQPSLFEGWSTVVEDSRALGKRLALSDLPVHREQDPPGATYFDPRDAHHLAELLAEWWQTLAPGPHQEAEAEARQKNRLAVENFGRRFLALASASVGNG